MGLNMVDDYFRKDTELQNYTKTGVKRIMHFRKKTCIQDIFEAVPHVTVRRKSSSVT